MANWCNNKVTFNGDRDSLNKVLALFQEMIEKESKGNIGQLPDFIESKNDYFFEIYRSETDECSSIMRQDGVQILKYYGLLQIITMSDLY